MGFHSQFLTVHHYFYQKAENEGAIDDTLLGGDSEASRHNCESPRAGDVKPRFEDINSRVEEEDCDCQAEDET
jgi:hypothetical protein